MISTNKKLIKNFREILAASVNAKGLIAAEMEKVDAKYAALAEKEKAEYTKQAKALDAQIEMCNSFLNGADTSAPDKEPVVEEKEEATAPVEEDVVKDTLFEENNEPEVSEQELDSLNEFSSSSDTPDLDAEEDAEWGKIESGEIKEVSSEDSPEEGEINTDDGWPEFPEEWK